MCLDYQPFRPITVARRAFSRPISEGLSASIVRHRSRRTVGAQSVGWAGVQREPEIRFLAHFTCDQANEQAVGRLEKIRLDNDTWSRFAIVAAR
jgi:hypothetical protein